jgi:hypothetical protein
MDSHGFNRSIRSFMAGDLYTGATQSSCPRTVDTVRHHTLIIVAVPSSSTMYLPGTILLIVFMLVVAGLCHSCGAAAVQKSTHVVVPVATGLLDFLLLSIVVSAHDDSLRSVFVVLAYLTAGPWSFGLPRRHSCSLIAALPGCQTQCFVVVPWR